jgi:hypothetical protein
MKMYASKMTGVTWHAGRQEWRAQIQIGGKQKNLGAFDTEAAAAEAYQQELERHNGTPTSSST